MASAAAAHSTVKAGIPGVCQQLSSALTRVLVHMYVRTYVCSMVEC